VYKIPKKIIELDLEEGSDEEKIEGVEIEGLEIEDFIKTEPEEKNPEIFSPEVEIDLDYYENLKINNESKTYNVLLLLPFYTSLNDSLFNTDSLNFINSLDYDMVLNVTDSLNFVDTTPKPEEIFEDSEWFLEFYHGAMAAIDSMKKNQFIG